MRPSMNQVATLGVRHGDVLVVSAAGPQAEDGAGRHRGLALDNFGDPIEVTEPTEIIATAVSHENPHERQVWPPPRG